MLGPILGAFLGVALSSWIARVFGLSVEFKTPIGFGIAMAVAFLGFGAVVAPRGLEDRRKALMRYLLAFVPGALLMGLGTGVSVYFLPQGARRFAGIIVSYFVAVGCSWVIARALNPKPRP